MVWVEASLSSVLIMDSTYFILFFCKKIPYFFLGYCSVMAEADIYKLCSLLQFPEKVISTSRVTSTDLECIYIMLRRLAYPNRLKDVENILGGRHQSEISVLCTYAVQHVYNTHRHLLLNINQTWIIDNIPLFAEAITNAGSPLTNLWEFVNGTVRPIRRPTNNQRV